MVAGHTHIARLIRAFIALLLDGRGSPSATHPVEGLQKLEDR
jgi:hypothetical protein